MTLFKYLVLAFAVLLIGAGTIIWQKQKMNWIYGKFGRNLKPNEVKEYTGAYGKSYIILGFSMIPLGLFHNTQNMILETVCLVVWLVGFYVSTTMTNKINKKLNSKIFK